MDAIRGGNVVPMPAPEEGKKPARRVRWRRAAALAAARREALQQGRQVKLSGFGNFDLRRKNERPGRNPKTGEEIPISARTVVTFRPGQKLKERVEAYSPGEDHA